jgi:hypothetical protein
MANIVTRNLNTPGRLAPLAGHNQQPTKGFPMKEKATPTDSNLIAEIVVSLRRIAALARKQNGNEEVAMIDIGHEAEIALCAAQNLSEPAVAS